MLGAWLQLRRGVSDLSERGKIKRMVGSGAGSQCLLSQRKDWATTLEEGVTGNDDDVGVGVGLCFVLQRLQDEGGRE